MPSISARARATFACATSLLAFALGLGTTAHAQQYPSRPITIIVSLAAGTGMDTLVRLYGEKLSQALGQPVVIENKPGGAGVIAGETILKGAPDGYTLAVATSAVMAIRPTLFKVRPFDPLTDFIPISNYVKSPFVLIVNPVDSGQDRAGVHRLRQAAPRTAQLQLVRHRRRAASDDGIAEAEVRARHGPCALSQQPAIDRRRRGRPRQRGGRRGRRVAAADQGRQAARACGHVVDPLPGAAGRAAARRSGRQCRAWKRCRGTCCSPAMARRARSSTGCTARCSASWRRPRCSSASLNIGLIPNRVAVAGRAPGLRQGRNRKVGHAGAPTRPRRLAIAPVARHCDSMARPIFLSLERNRT